MDKKTVQTLLEIGMLAQERDQLSAEFNGQSDETSTMSKVIDRYVSLFVDKPIAGDPQFQMILSRDALSREVRATKIEKRLQTQLDEKKGVEQGTRSTKPRVRLKVNK